MILLHVQNFNGIQLECKFSFCLAMKAFLEPRDSTCKELQEEWTISHWMGSAIPLQAALDSIMIDSITYSWQFAVTSNNSLAEA